MNFDFPTARSFQLQAERIAEELNDGNIHGVKCWYSSARLIEDGAVRAFVGINPKGGSDAPRHDLRFDYLEMPYRNLRQRYYNAWLDEIWIDRDPRPHHGPVHQSAAVQVFQHMYHGSWEQVLRKTACFNVVPFRTMGVQVISTEAWKRGTEWALSVFEHVRPRLVICNGNSRSKSSWSVLSKAYGIDSEEIAVGAAGSTATIKNGVIVSGPLRGSRVIGLLRF